MAISTRTRFVPAVAGVKNPYNRGTAAARQWRATVGKSAFRGREAGVQVEAFANVEGIYLDFRVKTLRGKVGRGLATFIRKHVRRGVTPSGQALPRGRDGKRPWRDTGALIRSIKFQNGRYVLPSGQHYSGKTNMLIAGVLVYGRGQGDHRRRLVSPFEAQARSVVNEVGRLADKEMARQVAKGQARLTLSKPRQGTKRKFRPQFMRKQRRGR